MTDLIKKPKTTIVVVCWNAIEYSKLTLKRLSETIHHPYNLIIVDNLSTDGTQKYLKKFRQPDQCKNLKIIFNRKNLGYGGAVNVGYEKSLIFDSKFTCVCNNDLYFQNNWLKKLEDVMSNNPKIGILGTLRPAVNYRHHSRAGSTKQIVDSTPKNLAPRGELSYFLDDLAFDEAIDRIIKINGGGVEYLNCPPNAVITCCALVRNKVIRSLCWLADPRFKTYGSEDIDLSWSINKLGYRCAVLRDVYTHHFRHKSIDASNLDRNRHLQENNQIFFNKWSRYIYKFLAEKQAEKLDLGTILNNESNHEYWILRRLNDNIHFWDGKKLVTK